MQHASSDEDLATQAERDAVPEELLRNVALQGFQVFCLRLFWMTSQTRWSMFR